MEDKFPQTVFLSEAGSGEDAYLSASKTEEEAIKVTDDESTALVAEYKLIAVRKRQISTSVIDA